MPDSNNKSTQAATCEEIINSLADYAIITIDKELQITGWYAGAEDLLGYKKEEVSGKPIKIFFTEEDIKNDIHKIEAEIALREGSTINERWHVRKDNQRFFGFGLIFPLKNKDGEWIGFTKIFRNLTERKKAELELRNSYKELEELNFHKEKIVSVLSHDLRSPLNSILGASQILADNFDILESAEMEKMLKILNKSATNVIGLLDELTNWAKAKYTEDIFNPQENNLFKIAVNAYNILKEYAHNKGIKFINNLGENVYVKADRKMLLSVFQNLLSNAIKFTELDGTITASAIVDGGKDIVSISDTGIGIPLEIKETLLQSSPVDSKKDTQKEVGSGIGL
ncbi:MAG: PAS domain-containing sensor histidine kinase, partial [Bacteroidetes bacterium]|nr:PAS domain-containing sensor histidine kinase [Bacteroidota bacterium]